MPILPQSDPLWQKLPRSVDILLPDIPEIAADAGNAPVFSVAQGKYTAQAAEIFQLSSQVALGNIVSNVGMPMKSMFDVILKAMEIDVRKEFSAGLKAGGRNLIEAWKAIQDGGETGAAVAEVTTDTTVGVAVDVASIIPVAGWVIKIAWTIGKTVTKLVKFAKETDAYKDVENFHPPTTFNPQMDNMVLNAVLDDVFGKRDWSRRWGPPRLGQGQGTTEDFRVLSLEGGGFEIVRKQGYEDGVQIDWNAAGWLGMIPGAPFLHQGVQFRNNEVFDMGDILLPSARQVLLWLWGTVLGHKSTVTPSMWCVDTAPLRAWTGYIYDLHTFIHDHLSAKRSVKEKIMRYYNKRGEQEVFGWGTDVKPKENEWEKYLPYKRAETLRARQMGFLDTLMCAYVDDSYAAIKKDDAMKSRWDERRRQLLEHPARCDVDLDNVPDSEYRYALIDSGAKSPAVCQTVGMQFAAREFEPPKRVPPGAGYASPHPKSKPKRKLPAIVPFAAVGGALLAGYKAGIVPAIKLPKLKL